MQLVSVLISRLWEECGASTKEYLQNFVDMEDNGKSFPGRRRAVCAPGCACARLFAHARRRMTVSVTDGCCSTSVVFCGGVVQGRVATYLRRCSGRGFGLCGCPVDAAAECAAPTCSPDRRPQVRQVAYHSVLCLSWRPGDADMSPLRSSLQRVRCAVIGPRRSGKTTFLNLLVKCTW